MTDLKASTTLTLHEVEAPVLNLKDAKGVSFASWESYHSGLGEAMTAFTTEELPNEPGPLTSDLTCACAWLAYALAREAEAEVWEERALSTAKLAAKKHLKSHDALDIAKLATWRVKASRGFWHSTVKAMQEKVWTARGLLESMNQERKSLT